MFTHLQMLHVDVIVNVKFNRFSLKSIKFIKNSSVPNII